MKTLRSFSALSAATVFGAVALAAQALLLRRFLWRFESAETGVALFLSCWLFWTGMGAAAAATPLGCRLTGALSRVLWLLVAACAALYFAQYALIENLKGWLGLPGYQAFPLAQLALGCLLANAPFCLVAGFVVPAACRRLEQLGGSVSRVFAWEALGASVAGLGVVALLASGVAPDPRDEAEWFRYFPQATERPGRFETGGGTTFYGSQGGTFYALSSSGVSEVIPEGDRAAEVAVLILSQRPYAKEVLLAGQVPLAVGLALEALRPDLSILWCPCDAQYGVSLLRAAQSAGVQTRVQATGAPPQQFLSREPDAAFDAVLAAAPPATSLGGAAWRGAAFARSVRRVTRRTGVALFGLGCEAATLTPEKAALLDVAVRGVRQAWPESGVLAPGAGGWWLAAQVPRLAYGAEDATNRFALLKRESCPAEAVWRLYDPARARQWARQVPALDLETAGGFPEEEEPAEILSLGQAEAVRRAYPETTPGLWLSWLKAHDGVRLIGLLLVVLWMLPVALGGRTHASRRLVAAWLAACGALGLAASLTVLYTLQLRFGSLYLLSGAGNCLYLAGLFCGNRSGAAALHVARERPRVSQGLLLACTLVQAGGAFFVLAGAAWAATATGVILLCFVAGAAAGAAVPTALAVCEGSRADSAAVFVLADALGAAVAGLAFVALVPLAGLRETVVCFAALACGLALCAVLGRRYARLTAGLALVATLAVLGRCARDAWPERRLEECGGGALVAPERMPMQGTGQAATAEARLPPAQGRGIPRKIVPEVILDQMRSGRLATNSAAFWEPAGR